MKLLTDRVAWVTGASRGIGRSIALTLAREGAHLFLVARDAEHLSGVYEQIVAEGGANPVLLSYNISEPKDVANACAQIAKQHGRLDIMVNNAGVLQEAMLATTTPEQLEEAWGINVAAVIYHMQYAAKLMARTKRGSIVNVGSIMGRAGSAGLVAYSASKAAVLGATRSAAKELGPLNIRVNAVSPGFIDTDMTKALASDQYQRRLAQISMRRAGAPEDVANAVLFLASDLSTYVTGQDIGIDGGMVV